MISPLVIRYFEPATFKQRTFEPKYGINTQKKLWFCFALSLFTKIVLVQKYGVQYRKHMMIIKSF